MKKIIEAIPKEFLEEEIAYKKAKLLKYTNRGEKEIYIFSSNEAPYFMKEVARLREISFRHVGGGTGLELDIDEYDYYFDQIIIWNPKKGEIIGGYRIQKMKDLSLEQSPLCHFFDISEDFEKKYMPYAIELGRSFIIPEYQGGKTLNNLFDGIGYIISKDKSIKYLIGKLTLYPKDNEGNLKNLNIIHELINKHFTSQQKLIIPKSDFVFQTDSIEPSGVLTMNIRENIKLVMRNYSAPPLLSVYAGLSDSLQAFGTIIHKEFGNVQEVAMMTTIDDIYPEVKKEFNIL